MFWLQQPVLHLLYRSLNMNNKDKWCTKSRIIWCVERRETASIKSAISHVLPVLIHFLSTFLLHGMNYSRTESSLGNFKIQRRYWNRVATRILHKLIRGKFLFIYVWCRNRTQEQTVQNTGTNSNVFNDFNNKLYSSPIFNSSKQFNWFPAT